MRKARKYSGLIIPIALVSWRVWSLGWTSFETLAHQPAGAAAADFKLSVMASMWVAVLALLFVAVVLEREPLSSIGFRWPTWGDLAWVPACLIATVIVESLWTMLLLSVSGHTTAIVHAPVAALPLGIRILMFGTEPFFEETVFRSYTIEKLESLTGTTGGAVCASVLGSSLMHGGWMLGLTIIPLGLGAAMLYVWRRSLPACLVFHSLWMLTALLW